MQFITTIASYYNVIEAAFQGFFATMATNLIVIRAFLASYAASYNLVQQCFCSS